MRGSWTLWWLFAGCHSVHATQLPDLSADDARSLILLIEGDERRAHAWDLVNGGDAHLTFEGDARVWLLSYRESLEALSLEPGPLDFTDEGRALPMPFAVRSAALGGDDASDWEMHPALPEALQALRIPAGRDPCVELERIPMMVEETSVLSRTLVPLDDRTAFVSNGNGELFIVDVPAREARRIGLALDPRPAAAARGPEGEIWLVDAEGGLSRLTLGPPPVIERSFASLTSTWDKAAIAASPPGEELELFVVGQYSSLARFDGTSWETIFEPTQDVEWRASVIRTGPRHAIAIGPRHPLVVEVQGDEIIEHDLGGDFLNSPGRVFRLPGVGTMVATASDLYVLEAGWTRVAKFALGYNIRSVAALDDGFLAGTEGGTLLQWQAGQACDAVKPVDGDINEIYPFGDELLFANDVGQQKDPPLSVLRRK